MDTHTAACLSCHKQYTQPAGAGGSIQDSLLLAHATAAATNTPVAAGCSRSCSCSCCRLLLADFLMAHNKVPMVATASPPEARLLQLLWHHVVPVAADQYLAVMVTQAVVVGGNGA